MLAEQLQVINKGRFSSLDVECGVKVIHFHEDLRTNISYVPSAVPT